MVMILAAWQKEYEDAVHLLYWESVIVKRLKTPDLENWAQSWACAILYSPSNKTLV